MREHSHSVVRWWPKAQVEQWIDFSTLELDAPLLSWFLPLAGFLEYNKKVFPSCPASVSQHAQSAAWPAARVPA